ncbi:hypothetical protein [Tenacibaculum finnmarkense]|uniref:hypothetical protein n=1 Tax=Tenacibaculum finnmarkense TaxID=2781243 RepID=UPI001E3A4A47|nr:hypothetical protein [Tenacibaculum finnmarkense]MCD8413610.1 hypothetical protein [Tenacibaculum finnmarkense genomovar ulcerans]
MKLLKTIPKDKSSEIDWDNNKGSLKCSKPLLVFYQMTPTEIGFKRANYVHSKKYWVDWEGFCIYDDEFIGWCDILQFFEYN